MFGRWHLGIESTYAKDSLVVIGIKNLNVAVVQANAGAGLKKRGIVYTAVRNRYGQFWRHVADENVNRYLVRKYNTLPPAAMDYKEAQEGITPREVIELPSKNTKKREHN